MKWAYEPKIGDGASYSIAKENRFSVLFFFPRQTFPNKSGARQIPRHDKRHIFRARHCSTSVANRFCVEKGEKTAVSCRASITEHGHSTGQLLDTDYERVGWHPEFRRSALNSCFFQWLVEYWARPSWHGQDGFRHPQPTLLYYAYAAQTKKCLSHA